MVSYWDISINTDTTNLKISFSFHYKKKDLQKALIKIIKGDSCLPVFFFFNVYIKG